MQFAAFKIKREGRSFRRRLWGRLLRLRYLLFQRHRHGQLVFEEVAGYAVLVLPQVFNPVLFRSGELLARSLDAGTIPPGSLVLDMGTGSGIGALAAARWARQVVAIDINPAAVRCARINVLLNGVEDRVEVRESDLFAALADERFDVILFNPPYYAGRPGNALGHAFYATDVAERFARNLPGHLTPGGYALVLLSSDGQPEAFLAAFDHNELAVYPLRQYDLINEVLTVYKIGSRHCVDT